MSRNKVAELPDWLAALPNLRSLKMAHNELAVFPDIVLDMTKLQELSLAHNPFPAVPPLLSRLSGLHRLSLSGCGLQSLPKDLFRRMPHLRSLELADNRLTELPFLLPLEALQSIDISGNSFTALPSEIIRLRSHRKLNLQTVIGDNPYLADGSPQLDQLTVHVPSLRDLALTKCTNVHQVKNLKGVVPQDIWDALNLIFHVCDGRGCERVIFGIRYTSILTLSVGHQRVPVNCHFCSYACVPKKVTQPIERVAAARKREEAKEAKRREKRAQAATKTQSKAKRVRRDDSPTRRILPW